MFSFKPNWLGDNAVVILTMRIYFIDLMLIFQYDYTWVQQGKLNFFFFFFFCSCSCFCNEGVKKGSAASC